MTMEPFIIAEVGSTWKTKNGKDDLTNCLACCNLAAEYGASAVKFQFFTHEEMYGYPGDNDYCLPAEFIPALAEYCNDLCIEFMASAFSKEGFAYLDNYVMFHKIASSKVGDLELMSKVWESTKLCLVSDGMFHVEPTPNVVPMLCASAYPAAISDYSLADLNRYNRNPRGWGFSDHTSTYQLATLMRSNGCSFFEKHVDFLGTDKNNPDFLVSIQREAFGDYTDAIRKTEVGRPIRLRKEARNRWGDRYDKEVKRYVRPRN